MVKLVLSEGDRDKGIITIKRQMFLSIVDKKTLIDLKRSRIKHETKTGIKTGPWQDLSATT